MSHRLNFQTFEPMGKPFHIICTVTNDLNFDQRMIRICNSLAINGYKVTLIGRKLTDSQTITERSFRQVRLYCFFKKGVLFYTEYNIRLFFWLLLQHADCVCAIDLDTILPCLWASKIKRWKRIYDAHELFCEMKEVVSRPSRYRIWKKIERYAVPKFKFGYTVCQPIADEFKKMYGVEYNVIRNIALLKESELPPKSEKTFFIYQGAVNEGRSFETLIPAMNKVKTPLYVYGDGNYFKQTQKLIEKNHLSATVKLMGKLKPEALRQVTLQAYAGITLFENNSQNNYLSLANRFFDYIQAGIPQLCMNYPAYKEINDKYGVAILIDDLSSETISKALNLLVTDHVLYNRLKQNCVLAKKELNWQAEEKKLISIYRSIEK